MAGRQEIYEGALKQAGILPLKSAEALLDAARGLAMCPLPKGPRMAVLSGQAGPGMAACDLCESQGLELAVFKPETQSVINELLPPLALRTNPVDMGPAWYNASAIEGIIRAVIEDEGVNGLLLLMMFASANRAALQRYPRCCWNGNNENLWFPAWFHLKAYGMRRSVTMENGGALINCPTPERAATTMASLWEYKKMIGSLVSSFRDAAA
jgi:acyl-CoA synthetase (NDP forming)